MIESGNNDDDIKGSVCRLLGMGTRTSSVHVVQRLTTGMASRARTSAIVLPEQDCEDVRYLLLETTESVEQRGLNVVCGRFKTDLTICQMKQLIKKELYWKSVTVCMNNKVLPDDQTIRDLDLQNTALIQVLQLGSQTLKFHYQPSRDISTYYTMEVDMKKSVSEVKQEFETRFKKGIDADSNTYCYFQKREINLDDDVCMAMATQNFPKEEEIKVYFCEKNAIKVSVTFQRPLKHGTKSLIIKRNCSTAELRAVIAKTLPESDCKNPFAIKVLLMSRLINEHDDLEVAYPHGWKDGCALSCGIKKPKCLQIKHPETGEELKFQIFMLQKVGCVKKYVCAKWQIPELSVSLYCQGIKMKSNELLLKYPVKNNIDIEIQLYPHRVAVQVVVVFQRKELFLKVDNSGITTVDDLLRYCAKKLNYRRICSRGLFQDRCLNKHRTLLDEGFTGTTSKVCIFIGSNLLSFLFNTST